MQVARASRPLSKPLVYRGASNLRRLYEQADMPDRLVVIGDSLCSFNPVRPPEHLLFMLRELRSFFLFKHVGQGLSKGLPVQAYGQGMTVGALEAQALQGLLQVTACPG